MKKSNNGNQEFSKKSKGEIMSYSKKAALALENMKDEDFPEITIPEIKINEQPTETQPKENAEISGIEINETDIGNAMRFVSQHGEGIRYCHPLKAWYVYNGQYWEVDRRGKVKHKAIETALSIYKEEAKGRYRRNLDDWARNSESRAKISAMVNLAEAIPQVTVVPEDFDQNQWILNVENGTIDLKTGKLLQHNKNDLITKIAPVEFNPEASCDVFEKFLNKIFDNNQNLISYIQRLFGYCLTGSTKSAIFPIFWGDGGNGKSTLVESIQALMGDYATPAPRDLLLARKGDSHPTGLASLVGSRLATAEETDKNKKLAEAMIKQITGGDEMQTRYMYGDYFKFKPTFKIILSTNHEPTIQGTDHGIWRRINLIPFTVKISDEEKDENFLELKFKYEWPGILNWLIEGCLAWQKRDLDAPPEVIKATNEYRNESDVIGEWIEERAVVNKILITTTKELFENYVDWCKETDERPISNKAFGKKLSEKGLIPTKKWGQRCWQGIGLKE